MNNLNLISEPWVQRHRLFNMTEHDGSISGIARFPIIRNDGVSGEKFGYLLFNLRGSPDDGLLIHHERGFLPVYDETRFYYFKVFEPTKIQLDYMLGVEIFEETDLDEKWRGVNLGWPELPNGD